MVCVELHDLLATIGLLLDILGVSVLFVFGLPENILKGRVSDAAFRVEGQEPSSVEIENERLKRERQSRQRRNAAIGHWVGLSALVVGFSLQIVAVWVA